MIVSQINFDAEQRTVLLVVIENDNLKRMQAADPITQEAATHGGLLQAPKYPANFSVLVAYEEDEVELYKLASKGDVGSLIRYLERGRQWDESKDGKKNAFHHYRVSPKPESGC